MTGVRITADPYVIFHCSFTLETLILSLKPHGTRISFRLVFTKLEA